jgi:hypothetical protein
MKKLIPIITIIFILTSCAFIQSKPQPRYTVIELPAKESGHKLNLPEGTPDITTFDMKWMDRFSNVTCALYFRNSETEEFYSLVVMCDEIRVLGLVDCNCDDESQEAEYYIYKQHNAPKKVTYKKFKAFIAEYDPAWRERKTERKDTKRI